MSARRYQQVSAHDEEEHTLNRSQSSSPSRATPQHPQQIPNSPPPSFRSRSSSPSSRDRERLISDSDRTLADTFDSHSDDEDDDDRELDERQRVMSGRPAPADSEAEASESRPAVERRVTQLPVFAPATATSRGRTYGGGNSVHDGVFANLSAKPERGEELEEKPPTYEQAAADATPPYWETTILAPGGSSSDEVFIDGLPVGSLFSFIWNGMISMSFQLVGFLLTYLLHTTHAAKNGSKAGLGITLVQYGFTMKGTSSAPNHGHKAPNAPNLPGSGSEDFTAPPTDPNGHNFDASSLLGSSLSSGVAQASQAAASFATQEADAHRGTHGSAGKSGFGAMTPTDWFAYALMIVGWFVLIRAISEYLKARRHEALVLQSPTRGLTQPVVAEGEEPSHSV